MHKSVGFKDFAGICDFLHLLFIFARFSLRLRFAFCFSSKRPLAALLGCGAWLDLRDVPLLFFSWRVKRVLYSPHSHPHPHPYAVPIPLFDCLTRAISTATNFIWHFKLFCIATPPKRHARAPNAKRFAFSCEIPDSTALCALHFCDFGAQYFRTRSELFPFFFVAQLKCRFSIFCDGCHSATHSSGLLLITYLRLPLTCWTSAVISSMPRSQLFICCFVVNSIQLINLILKLWQSRIL